MRRIVFAVMMSICLSTVGVELHAGTTSQILKKVGRKNRFPFALLTKDHGILNVNDLAMNSCDADPVAFSKVPGSYPYWQCFPVSQIKFKCDSAGQDEATGKETALLLINVSAPTGQQQFVPRRAMDVSNCRWFQKRWRQAIRNQRFACLLGAFSGFEKDGDQPVAIWVFDKFKSKKGCGSYFYGDCSLSYAKKQGCDI